MNGRVYSQMVALSAVDTGPGVTEKAFDEYHLYTLERPTTLHDRETKQVEFVRAAGVKSKTAYVYDGWRVDANYFTWPMETIRTQDAFGTQSNTKVWVTQEFKNSNENHLGMPLPKGRVRFYRRDDDGQLEFTGRTKSATRRRMSCSAFIREARLTWRANGTAWTTS